MYDFITSTDHVENVTQVLSLRQSRHFTTLCVLLIVSPEKRYGLKSLGLIKLATYIEL